MLLGMYEARLKARIPYCLEADEASGDNLFGELTAAKDKLSRFVDGDVQRLRRVHAW